MSTKNILITGGAGFIGINTANYYLSKNYNVTILDNFSRNGSKENLKWLKKNNKKAAKIITADIVKDRKVLAQAVSEADVVFHLAAQVAVTSSVKNPMHDFKINALGTLHVLEAIRKSANKPILLYSSTNKVYGDLAGIPFIETKTRYKLKDHPYGIDEKYPLNFKSPYGCSKGTGDQYIHDYSTIYGLKTIVFRQSCIYGPHQFGIVDQGWIAWFLIALMVGKNITIYGTGKQVRDLLYVDDLVKAYDMAVSNIDVTQGQVYNIGGGMKNTISVWYELKPILEKLFKGDVSMQIADERPGDQKLFVADIRKAKKDFGWEPKIGVNQGIEQLYKWVKENKVILKDVFNV